MCNGLILRGAKIRVFRVTGKLSAGIFSAYPVFLLKRAVVVVTCDVVRRFVILR